MAALGLTNRREQVDWRGTVPSRSACLIVLLLGTVFYARTLYFGFVYDDFSQIVGNPRIQSWDYFFSYFTQHVWAHVYGYAQANYYRPIFLVWLLLNEQAFGMNPVGWHLTTVLAHLAASCLVFAVTMKLLQDWRPATLAAAVFLLHPAQLESVAWISGVSEPLLAIFILGSFYAYLQHQESGSPRYFILSLTAFVLALLCKETAVAFPLVVFLHSWLLGPQRSTRTTQALKSAIWVTVPYVALLVPYLVARSLVLHSPLQAKFKVSLATALLTAPYLACVYLKHLVLPVNLALNYHTPYVTTPGVINFILPLVVLAVVAIATGLFARRSPVAGFAAVWILTFLLLPIAAANLFVYFDLVHDRYLYLPMVGFAVLLGLAWQRTTQTSAKTRRWGLAAAVVVVSLYAAGTLAQQPYWANNRVLYQRSLTVSPEHFLPRVLLASALQQGNDTDKEQALRLLREAETMSNGHWLSILALAGWYYEELQYDQAEKYYLWTIELNPANPLPYYLLAETRLRMAKPREALEPLQQAVRMVPGNLNYRLRYASALEQAGDPSGAVEQYRAVLLSQPNETALRNRIITLEQRLSLPSSQR